MLTPTLDVKRLGVTQISGCLLIESLVTFNFLITLLSASIILHFTFEGNRRECFISAILDCCSRNSQSTPNFFQVCQRARRALQTFRLVRTLARTSSQVRPIMMVGPHRYPTCRKWKHQVVKQKFFESNWKRVNFEE